MKQTVEQRKLHHKTREDRRRDAYESLQRRIFFAPRTRHDVPPSEAKLARMKFDLARLAEKLGLSAQDAAKTSALRAS